MTIAVGGVALAQSQVNAQGGLIPGIGGSATAPPTTCALDNIGWLMCPILRSAAKAGDHAFTFITQDFLGIEFTLFNADSGTQQAWSTVRSVANVAFGLAFLVVIYSLITGRGVGNYNIKRMLPRFIVGAILVNISYYICQLAIDISNIIGSSIHSAFTWITQQIGPSGMPLGTTIGEAEVLAQITASVLGKPDVAWVLLAPLLAIVLSIAIICSVILVILLIRKTLVVAMVLLSPLAFVAYLLPNTEHYFSKWMSLFFQTLLLFPVVAILIGTGQVVSATIIQAGDSGYEVRNDSYIPPGEQGEASATLRLVAAGAAVLPLAGTWYAFKAAMAGMDAAALRIRQGARRSERHRDESAKKREQAAMDLNKKSMMLKGVNRLQQINAVQDSEGGTSIIGRLGGAHRSRKKQQKSEEQMEFDQQVQGRLNDLRKNGGEDGLSPQQLYSRALQRYQDAEGASPDGQFNINSYEGIDLKAAEAYLLENIGQGGNSGVAGVVAAAQASQAEKGQAGAAAKDGKDGKNGETSNPVDEQGASSHYDKASQAKQSHNVASGDDALKSATLGGGAVQAGKVTIIQADATEGGDAARTMGTRKTSDISVARDNDPVSAIEMEAKGRAARYLQKSQDAQGIEDADALLGSGSSSAEIVRAKRKSVQNEQDGEGDSGLKLPRR